MLHNRWNIKKIEIIKNDDMKTHVAGSGL